VSIERVKKLYVQLVGDRWVFGREGTLFESFPTMEAAVVRAKEFAQKHPDHEVVIVDREGNERPA